MHKKGKVEIPRRRRRGYQDELEEGSQVFRLIAEVFNRIAVEARGVDVGEIELLIVGAEFHEKIEGQVQRPVWGCMGPVDLVEDDDRPKAHFERLRKDEAGLRHRPFLGIDEEKDGVDHPEDPLHFAGKVGVARRVDNVDFKIFIVNAGMLGEDRDSPFLLLVETIHDPLRDFLMFAENIGLFEQIVEKGGLPVVDVGDDRDISDLLWVVHMVD